jgi:hypothetical protein
VRRKSDGKVYTVGVEYRRAGCRGFLEVWLMDAEEGKKGLASKTMLSEQFEPLEDYGTRT